MTSVVELIKRLDAATGPDRNLDVAIYDTVLAPQKWKRFSTSDARDMVRPDGAGGWVDAPVGGSVTTEDRPVRRYTSSLDAALTLVPAYMVWVVDSGEGGKPSALVAPEIGYEDFRHYGATPAIALCISALWTVEALP